MRSDFRVALASVLGLVVVLGGCLPPEIDTPPIDPSLIDDQTSGSGASACVDQPFVGNLELADGTELPAAFESNCTIQGNVTITLDGAPPLAKIAMVRTITGQLLIQGTATKTPSLLPNLESVSKIGVKGAQFPDTFPPFSKLTTVKDIYMSGVHAKSMKAFNALFSAERIEVLSCVISAIEAFNKLEEVAFRIDFKGNYATTSFKTFQSLRSGPWMRFEGLTIGGVVPLSFPELTSASDLQISDIQQLSKLSLPKLQYLNSLQLGLLPGMVHPDPIPLTKIVSLSFHSCGQLNDVDWLPATTQLASNANICKSGPNLATAVREWVKNSGSTAEVTEKLCN